MPQPIRYSSTFGTRMYFNQPGPGWLYIGAMVDGGAPDHEPVFEWVHLRTPDLIELASAASDATEGLEVKESGEYGGATLRSQSEWRERAWRVSVAVRRFLLRLQGKELIAYSGPNVRWTLAYNKGDEESRQLGQQMIRDSPIWSGDVPIGREEQ